MPQAKWNWATDLTDTLPCHFLNNHWQHEKSKVTCDEGNCSFLYKYAFHPRLYEYNYFDQSETLKE